MDIDALLIDLGVLSQLQLGDKPGVLLQPGSKSIVIDHASLWQPLIRYWTSRTREDFFVILEEIVMKCERAVSLLLRGEHATEQTNLRSAIDAALTGLGNLARTYESDSLHVAKVRVVEGRLRQLVRSLTTAREAEAEAGST